MCVCLSLGLKTLVEVPVLQDSCTHCPEWLPNPQAGRKFLSSKQCMAELTQGQAGGLSTLPSQRMLCSPTPSHVPCIQVHFICR